MEEKSTRTFNLWSKITDNLFEDIGRYQNWINQCGSCVHKSILNSRQEHLNICFMACLLRDGSQHVDLFTDSFVKVWLGKWNRRKGKICPMFFPKFTMEVEVAGS